MNITPNFQTLKLPAVLQQRQNNKKAFLADNKNAFVHSAPSFRGSTQLTQMAQKLLNDPGKILSVLGALFVLNPTAAENFKCMINELLGSEDNQDNVLSINTDNIKQKLQNIGDDVNTNTNEATEAELVQFVYPRSITHRKESTIETSFIAFVEELQLTNDYVEKLENICKKLQKKEDCYNINDNILSTINIIPLLKDDFVSTRRENGTIDYDAVKEIIDKYNSCLQIPAKIELINKDANRFQLMKEAKEAKQAKQEQTTNNNKEQTIITKIFNDDGQITALYFSKTGTGSSKTYDQLDEMYRFFVRKIFSHEYKDKMGNGQEAEKPKWLWNKPVFNRLDWRSVKTEINKCNKPGSTKSPYKNLIKVKPQQIADVINHDPRYHDFFDIHGAMRLLDRYVDFNSNDSIEDQSTRILNKLSEMIDKAYNNGTYIDVYRKKDKNPKYDGSIGAYIRFKAEDFDNEALEIFGSDDLIIGISECQDHSSKDYNSSILPNDKQALISTIYSEEI